MLEKRVIERRKLTEFELIEVRRLNKVVANDTSNGTYLPHVYRVFEDPDFQKDIKDLRIVFERLYYKDVSLTINYEDEHLLLEDKKIIKKVADKYKITLDDLGTYADGGYDDGYSVGKRSEEFGECRVAEIDGQIRAVYVLGTKTTLKTIKDQWPYIRAMRHILYGLGDSDGIKRSKSPDNLNLIYAIFKARLGNSKFSQIFSDYENHTLAGFSGNSLQFKSEESLERYYRKYAPKLQLHQELSESE